MLTPSAAHRWAGVLLRPVAWGAGLFCLVGLFLGLGEPVADGDPAAMSKVLLVSIPATWVSVLLFLTLAFWAALGLILEVRLPYLLVQAVAPTGGMFTFLALWTGAIWSKGATGVWWTGDARQVAEVMLLCLYIAVVGIPVLVSDSRRADRMMAVLAVFGAAYVILLFFAMQWWQVVQAETMRGDVPPSLSRQGGLAVLSMTVGLWMYATLAALMRLRQIILERELTPWNNTV